jgi:hypothetical protein
LSNTDVYEFLATSDPYVEDTDKLILYGQFVGSWHIDASRYEPDGGQKRAEYIPSNNKTSTFNKR